MGTNARIVAAVDQSDPALAVYRHNFPSHPVMATRVDSLDPKWLRSLDADLWWASPPCQPFTRRGNRRGLEDPRAETFKALLRHLDAVRPTTFAMENVEGFRNSDGHDLLRETLGRAGYGHVRERLLCPSELGVANRRPRFYLVASSEALREPAHPAHEPVPQPTLPQILDPDPDPDLWVDQGVLRAYRNAMHLVDEDDAFAVTNCFTSAYGRSHVRSGSFLRTAAGRVRRVSPPEILRLLGFADVFEVPTDLPLSTAWKLAGNSLSLEPVRRVLSEIPGLDHMPTSTSPRSSTPTA